MGSRIRGLEISNSVHPNDFLECIDVFPENPFSIIIEGNYFSGGNYAGNVQLLINNLAADLTPVYIKGNEFQGSTNNYYGIWTIKTSGDIIGNIFSSSDYDRAIVSYESELNLLGNELRSNSYLDIHILESTSYLMAPLFSDDKYYWYGGSNILESSDQNIEFDLGSEVFLDNGFNCLTAGEYTNIGGVLTSTSSYCMADQPYSVRKNYWVPLPPNSGIFCDGGPLIDLQYIPYNSECATEPENIIDYEIIDRGDGLVDTIWISEEAEEENVIGRNRSGGNIGSSGREDEELLTQSVLNKYRKNYDDAISELKNLIDNYDTSMFVNRALGELYMNYSFKDSGTVQSNTTTLFSNLKEYLEGKIEQYESNPSFVQKAYSYYLMCLTKILDYIESILGYENIMENHPDTVRRLLASWDRSANILLQEGSGGGYNDLNEKQKLEKLYKTKPVHLVVKNVFKKLASTFKSGKSKNRRNELKDFSERITRFNPQTRDELDSKISRDLEDLLFNKTQSNPVKDVLPIEYKLNQNYPNPFNPTTTISYEIPTDGLVKLKIFDITGREVMTLVNEYKQAGSYHINLNGSTLSSGIFL